VHCSSHTHSSAQSYKSAIDLNPGELIIAMDEPPNSFLLQELDQIDQKYRPQFEIKRVFIPKDPEWNFQLAKIVWECYSQAKYDKIFSFDIDSIVNKKILLGKDLLTDDVALVSFTKKLHIESISDMIRYFFYRLRVRTSKSIFTGNYWVNKTIFFNIIKESEYKKIKNGVDAFLLEQISKNNCKMIQRREIGVKALNKQNEDYDWRQFQDGMWLYAHNDEIKAGKLKQGTLKSIQSNPKLMVWVKSFAYQRWNIYKGYCWGEKNKDGIEIKMAKYMTFYEWSMNGNKHLPKIKFKDTGTGHDQY